MGIGGKVQAKQGWGLQGIGNGRGTGHGSGRTNIHRKRVGWIVIGFNWVKGRGKKDVKAKGNDGYVTAEEGRKDRRERKEVKEHDGMIEGKYTFLLLPNEGIVVKTGNPGQRGKMNRFVYFLFLTNKALKRGKRGRRGSLLLQEHAFSFRIKGKK